MFQSSQVIYMFYSKFQANKLESFQNINMSREQFTPVNNKINISFFLNKIPIVFYINLYSKPLGFSFVNFKKHQ